MESPELSGFYFKSLDEADEWLDFEADAEEREFCFYKENDRYEEWQRYWLPLWEANLAFEYEQERFRHAIAKTGILR